MNNLTNNSQSTQVQQPLLQNQAPTLVIDLKRNRIRIHRRTLHLLGDPNYVQLMVNPKQSVIAIKSCRAQDYRSEKIRWEDLGQKQCCEFYSKYLVKSLRNVCMDLVDEQRYSIIGRYIKTENLVTFCMRDSKPIEQDKE